jgi:hypothetical protein
VNSPSALTLVADYVDDYHGTQYVYHYTQTYGDDLSRFRSASQHSTPDVFGWRAPTPYSGYQKTTHRAVMNYRGTYRGDDFLSGTNHVHQPTLPADPSSTLLAQLQAEAEVKCLAKFGQAAVDLSVAFLERKQTANMVSDWCTSTTRLLRDLRKGRWERAWKTSTTKVWKWNKGVPRGWTPKALNQWRSGQPVTAVKNAWLTTRYGIAPSLMDIAGSVEAIEKADNGSFDRYIISNHSRRFDLRKEASTPVPGYFGRYVVVPCYTSKKTSRLHEVHVRLDATIDNSAYLRLRDVGLTNPLLTGWEVTPYSFVVDWFIGVGDFLEAINAWNGGYAFKAGSCTRYWNLRSTEVVETREQAPYSDVVISTEDVPHATHEGFTRSVYNTPPVPTIVTSRSPLNFERMWDSIFLLSNVLGNKEGANRAKSRMRNLRI